VEEGNFAESPLKHALPCLIFSPFRPFALSPFCCGGCSGWRLGWRLDPVPFVSVLFNAHSPQPPRATYPCRSPHPEPCPSYRNPPGAVFLLWPRFFFSPRSGVWLGWAVGCITVLPSLASCWPPGLCVSWSAVCVAALQNLSVVLPPTHQKNTKSPAFLHLSSLNANPPTTTNITSRRKTN
jgi:hypothetical protein